MAGATILDRINENDNDYSEHEIVFSSKVDRSLVSDVCLPGDDVEAWSRSELSIVTCAYNTCNETNLLLRSVDAAWKSSLVPAKFEVVLVDDGSTDGLFDSLKQAQFEFPLKFVQQSNSGLAEARNVGTALARYSVVLYADSDTILPVEHIVQHALRHAVLDKLVLLGFKGRIQTGDERLKSFEEVESCLQNIKIDTDSRLSNMIRGTGEVVPDSVCSATNNLKGIGYGKSYYCWNIGRIVCGFNFSCKRSEVLFAGGFHPKFRGWSGEDVLMGWQLAAQGNMIVPCFAARMIHIEHAPRSGSMELKLSEWEKNYSRARDLLSRKFINRSSQFSRRYPFQESRNATALFTAYRRVGKEIGRL